LALILAAGVIWFGGMATGQSQQGEPKSSPPAAAGKVEYERDIVPIFRASCSSCHAGEQPQAQLKLDSLAGIGAGGISGKVVVPGESKASSLYRRLTGADKPRMPFGSDPLSDEQIQLVAKWIDQLTAAELAGTAAPAPKKHWAYVKPVHPEPPQVSDPKWVRNPIDNFVMARLDKEGLQPSPEATRETLIRRLSLDLVGLPPTPEEVDAFLADKSPDAYEKLVDRLLASPHYGERWARPWLDLARYADSNGYEKDNLRVAWEYRDWVIKALNDDMSFREFTIEQIAGDMLPNPTTSQLIATGFLRNSMLNTEGGVDHEEYRYYTLVDRVGTTASVWLGSTMACAQCHNHKFDPFTQKDFYRMMAFYDNSVYREVTLGQGDGYIEEPDIELPNPEQAAKAKQIRDEMARLHTVLETPTPDLAKAQAEWEQKTIASEKDWETLRPSHAVSEGGATLTPKEDGSILAGGKNPEADTYTIAARTDRKGITGVRLECLKDPSLPHGGPGRDDEGNFFLGEVEVTAAPADKPTATQVIKWKEAFADESQKGYEVSNLVKKEKYVTGWAIEPTTEPAPQRRQVVLVPEKPFGFEGGTLLTIRLKHEMLHSVRNVGRFRLSVTSMERPQSIAELPAGLTPVLLTPADKRTAEQQNSLAAGYRAFAPSLQPTRDQIASLEKSLKDLKIPTAMIIRERPGYQKPSTLIRIKGSFTSPGDRVYAGVPTVLNPLPDNAMPNRLGLAEWLVSDDNPLTARVTVNHYWEQIFGHGIVETAEDFGSQGERPTHPELLDWLATEFMQQGWSMKKILRTIVTSATYRQSSDATPEMVERDLYNRLLARGPRVRVEGEMIRDISLATSGLLSPKVGGPSVFPFQTEGIWDRPYSNAKWEISQGEDRYRRALYTFWRRTSPYPSLVNFDAPSREFCTVRRVRTDTPLQALTTLNDPAFFEAARALAARIEKEGGTDPASRITEGFRLCTARRPRQAELDKTLGFYRQQLEKFQKDEKAAREIIKDDKAPPAEAADLAAWTMVSNVLLSLDETITKE
jgi:cytochrome c553